jgi:hypothetical protein
MHIWKPYCRLAAALLLVFMPTVASTQGFCPADPDDYASDDAAINQCLSLGGTVSLRDGTVGYIVETGLHLTISGTILKGHTGRPKIFGHPNLSQPILLVGADRGSGLLLPRVDSLLLPTNQEVARSGLA